MIGAPQIAALYTTDHQVQAAALPLIILVGFLPSGRRSSGCCRQCIAWLQEIVVPMVIYTITLWGIGLGGGYVLGLTNTFGKGRGAAGFWIAAIISLWLVAGMVALYLNAVSRAKLTAETSKTLT